MDSALPPLRHRCRQFDGDHPDDYRDPECDKIRQLLATIHQLHDYGHEELFLPEPAVAGGFGHCDDTLGRVNRSSLRFYEVRLAMELCGLLERFRVGGAPTLLWDLSPAWGGFAAQWRQLFPASTVILSGNAADLALSREYLSQSVPDSQIALATEQTVTDVCRHWQRYAFIFVPRNLLSSLDDLRLDGVVDLGGLASWTDAEAQEQIEIARRLGDPPFHCAMPETSSGANTSVLHRHYSLLAPRVREFILPPVGGPPTAREPVRRYRPPQQLRHFTTLASPPFVTGDRAPRVGLGMTVHNGGLFLETAMTSVLAQTHGEFVFTIVDDASTDGSSELLEEWAARDSRIRLHRQAQRVGMVRAWQLAYELARSADPELEYFAWVSDHDYWASDWLAEHLQVLESDPGVVLTYPLTRRMDLAGAPEPTGADRFDLRHVKTPASRVRHALRRLRGAGNMVYGLVRADALEKAGVFRPVLLPDRLLMMELALVGRFHQIQKFLWFRRVTGEASLPRQRRALFAEQRPWWTSAPWWLTHGWFFLRHAQRPEGLSRPAKLVLTVQLCRSQGLRQLDKRLHYRRVWKRVRGIVYRPLRRGFKRGRRGMQILRDGLLGRPVDRTRPATSK